jgi:hypothetical protein
MKRFHRRDLLKAGAAFTAAMCVPFSAGPALALGAPKKLVLVLASGGWDTTYALDPKPGSTIVDAPEGTVETIGGIPLLTHAERPSVKAFFEKYSGLSVVVNGMQVRSFVHSDCIKRVLTGTPSDQNPDLGAIAAFEHGKELPVPYLVLGNSSLSGPLASITGRAGMSNQLAALLAPDPAESLFSPTFVPSDGERGLVKKYLDASAERFRATRGAQAANAKEIDAYVKSIERQGLLRNFAKARGGFGARDYTPNLDVQVSLALDALEGDLCHSVLLELNDWDTHQDNTRQSEKYEKFFQGLGALAAGMEQRKLLDHSLVVVLSEMGRTPKLNASAGKDHWPVTSALVFGAGIAGGRVLGSTDDSLGAVSVDFATGQPKSDGKQIQTGNLIAAVLQMVGVEPEPHLPGMEPLHALAG